MAIIRQIPWTTQPPPRVGLNRANAITRDLKVAFAPAITGNDRNVVDDGALSNSRSHRAILREQSIVYSSGSPASAVTDAIDTNVPATNSGAHTYLFWWRVDTVGGGLDDAFGGTSVSGNNGWRLKADAQSGSVPNQTAQLQLTYGGVAQYANSSSFSVNVDFQQLGFSGTIGSDYDYVINGAFDSNIAVDAISNSSDNVNFFAQPNAPLGTQGEYALALYWERRLSEVEILSLYKNPWQLFQPRTQIIPTSTEAAAVGTRRYRVSAY